MSTTLPNINMLHQNRAVLSLHGIAHDLVSRNVTDFILPGITLDAAMSPTPFRDEPIAGDKVDWEPLVFTFLVDSDMANWKSLYDWILILGGYTVKDSHVANEENEYLTSVEGSIIIYSAKNNPIRKINIHGVFPTSLSELTFNEEDSEIVYNKATVTLNYSSYEFVK